MTESAPARVRAPSTAAVPIAEKARYALALFRDHWDRYRNPDDFGWLFANLAEYGELLRTYSGIGLDEADVFEIGYGARPYRLLALQGVARRAAGVDAETPIVDGSIGEWRESLRRDGAERFAKSFVRHILFDRTERRRLERELNRRGVHTRLDRDGLLVADAAEVQLPERSLDLIVSEDVFEHIPASSLARICGAMTRWLRPTGLALIRPNVFTGITGGHHLDWNRRSFTVAAHSRRTPPWGHLRGLVPEADSFLNHLSRADYRELFSEHFELVEERVALPDLGREYLTGETAGDLSGWTEDELFSNQVLFVLRPTGLTTEPGDHILI